VSGRKWNGGMRGWTVDHRQKRMVIKTELNKRWIETCVLLKERVEICR
jgi:hypothetical protein